MLPGYNQFESVGRAVTEFLQECEQPEAVWHKAANGTQLPIGFEVELSIDAQGLRVRGSHDSSWNSSKSQASLSPSKQMVEIKEVPGCMRDNT